MNDISPNYVMRNEQIAIFFASVSTQAAAEARG
jgi:hypothetical protein